MASDLYRIKPLVWREWDHRYYAGWNNRIVVAHSPVGWTYQRKRNGHWHGKFRDAEAAKAAAEKWYRERLLTALEKVDE